MQKVIEEMTEVIEKTFEVAKGIGAVCPSPKMIATDLYDAGYRKPSEGENMTINHPVDEFFCEKCGAIFRDVSRIEIDEDDGEEYNYEFEFKFCPRCGMKVKV